MGGWDRFLPLPQGQHVVSFFFRFLFSKETARYVKLQSRFLYLLYSVKNPRARFFKIHCVKFMNYSES